MCWVVRRAATDAQKRKFSVPKADGTKPELLLRTIEEFNSAVESLQPGDKITLANGTWTDVELEIRGTVLGYRAIKGMGEIEPRTILIVLLGVQDQVEGEALLLLAHPGHPGLGDVERAAAQALFVDEDGGQL